MIIVNVKIRSRVLRMSCWCMLQLMLVCSSGMLMASDHSAPPAQPANSYPAQDVHEDEKIVIAADPYDTQEKAAIFRVAYAKYGFLPIRLIVTNNSDRPISLADARIHFITAQNDKIPAAEQDDVDRRATRDAKAGKLIPLPAPLPPIHRKATSKNKEVDEDFTQFEFAALAVEPHTTRAGFLFYDIQGLTDPLKGGKLYLRMLHGGDGKELNNFEIFFDKYLAAEPH